MGGRQRASCGQDPHRLLGLLIESQIDLLLHIGDRILEIRHLAINLRLPSFECDLSISQLSQRSIQALHLNLHVSQHLGVVLQLGHDDLQRNSGSRRSHLACLHLEPSEVSVRRIQLGSERL